MSSLISILSQRIELLVEQYKACPQKRILIALAGGPGSGKTTLAAAVAKDYNVSHQEDLQVVPMDGFHLPQSTLKEMESSECPFQRRGAPFTFDARAFIDLVQELRDSPVRQLQTDEDTIYAPSFDHVRKDPVERDLKIPSSRRIVLLEGNYLLLDQNPWKAVHELVDETWFIQVPRDIAKTRLVARHIAAGIEDNTELAAQRAEKNDLRNADLIHENLLPSHVMIESVGEQYHIRTVHTPSCNLLPCVGAPASLIAGGTALQILKSQA